MIQGADNEKDSDALGGLKAELAATKLVLADTRAELAEIKDRYIACLEQEAENYRNRPEGKDYLSI